MVKDSWTKSKSPHVGRTALSILLAMSMACSAVPAYAVEEVLDSSAGIEEVTDADVSSEAKEVVPVEVVLDGDEDIEPVDAQPEAVPEVLSAESSGQTYVSDVALPSNDELLDAYAQQQLDAALPGSDVLAAQADAGDRLSGASAELYTALGKAIKKVAAGEEQSTAFVVNASIYRPSWTEEDLGVPIVVEGSTSINEAAMQKAAGMLNEEFTTVYNALLSDMPYEQYWHDKTKGMQTTEYGFAAQPNTDGKYTLTLADESLTFFFAVAQDYSAGEYLVKSSLGETITNAVARAKQIVNDNANLGTYARLKAYKDKICELVAYNGEAMRDESTPYGNPWQLIWVFDDDPNTKVVCEGYSKAFKYLADLSEGLNAQVITVSGIMEGGTGEGSHMWNIVRMDDGRNYLVDVTNCDDGFVGAPDQLFVAIPVLGSLAEGWYGFNTTHDSVTTQITYEYRENMATLFGEGALTLSQTEYVEGAGPAHSTDLADAVVSVTADGLVYTGHELTPAVTVTIDGTALVRGDDFDVLYKNNTNAGTATVTVTGKGNYTGTATGTFKIARAKVSAPAVANRTYTGKAQTGVAAGAGYALSGTAKATNAGSYTATATPDANHCWTDGTAAPRAVKWTIAKAASSISLADQGKTYTGKAVAYTGDVTRSGSAGVMTLAYFSDKACAKPVAVAYVKNAGTYYVRATLPADANHKAATSNVATLTVKKAAQPMKLKAVKRTAKASATKKKAVTVAAPLKFTKKAQGTVTYARVAKGSAKCLTVNKKTGKVTIKRGTKKDTYKVKIKVTAKGNKNYKSGSKTVTCTVVVK